MWKSVGYRSNVTIGLILWLMPMLSFANTISIDCLPVPCTIEGIDVMPPLPPVPQDTTDGNQPLTDELKLQLQFNLSDDQATRDAMSFSGILDSTRVLFKTDNERDYIGLKIEGAQPFIQNGRRTEIELHTDWIAGATVKYEWDMMIPSSFPFDPSVSTSFYSIAQWHEQPNAEIGETWATFQPMLPNIQSLQFFADEAGFFWARMFYAYDRPSPFSLGRWQLIKLFRNQWHHFTVVITWSQNPNVGESALYIDDYPSPYLYFKGRTMHNAYKHYHKIGQYRHQGFTGTNIMYYDNWKVTVLNG